MERNNLQLPLFWQSGVRQIPQRPDNPDDYPESDDRHWYDYEYAGWHVRKNPLPETPSDGPKGKKIIALIAGDHPYSIDFQNGLYRTAERFGFKLEVLSSQWESDDQEYDVDKAIALEPDLVIIWIENIKSGSKSIKRIYKAGIPVIAANTLPDDDGFKHLLSWTGPDDWAQFRLLSRRFASLMNNMGGFAVVSHIEGTSTYYARSWSVITELKKIAPDMILLDLKSTGLDREKTYQQVKKWLTDYGDDLCGIVSADDSITQLGINQAVSEAGREDIIRVASGSTPTGIELVRNGGVHAITYQLAEQDGSLPVKVAADWFNGLDITALRHLPVRILDRENIKLLVDRKQFLLNIDTDILFQNILDCHPDSVRRYFRMLTEDFSRSIDVSMEFFRGFCMEVFANLHHIIKSANLDEMSMLGNYEGIYKMIFQQPTMEKSIKWLEDTALAIIDQLSIMRNRHGYIVHKVIDYIKNNYNNPMSLKTLSYEFNISAPYLGKLFSDETGETFTNWLNRLRIEKAVELLKTTDLTIKEIAIKTGYLNSNYFYKIFKKYMKVNPGEYMDEL